MLASVDRRYSCCVCCKIFSFRFNGSHRLRVTPRETLATCPLLGKNRSAMSGLRATSGGSQGHPAQAGGHPSAAGVEYRRREAAQVPIYAAFLYSGAHCPLNRSKSTSRAIFAPELLPPRERRPCPVRDRPRRTGRLTSCVGRASRADVILCEPTGRSACSSARPASRPGTRFLSVCPAGAIAGRPPHGPRNFFKSFDHLGILLVRLRPGAHMRKAKLLQRPVDGVVGHRDAELRIEAHDQINF